MDLTLQSVDKDLIAANYVCSCCKHTYREGDKYAYYPLFVADDGARVWTTVCESCAELAKTQPLYFPEGGKH